MKPINIHIGEATYKITQDEETPHIFYVGVNTTTPFDRVVVSSPFNQIEELRVAFYRILKHALPNYSNDIYEAGVASLMNAYRDKKNLISVQNINGRIEILLKSA